MKIRRERIAAKRDHAEFRVPFCAGKGHGHMSVLNEYRDSTIYYHHSLDILPRSEDFPMHAHEMHEIFYFLSGKGRYIVEGNYYPLEPGSLMLMRSCETHKLLIQPDCPYERIAIHFSTEIVKAIDTKNALLHAFLDRKLGHYNLYDKASIRSGFINECLNNMETASAGDYSQRIAIISNLYPILSEIRPAFIIKQQETVSSLRRDISRELVDYINCNLNEELSLDELSKHFFMSKSQLNRVFKQATGSTIWDYILIKRLMTARQMLRTGMQALQVCQACGFRDYSSFYRIYKKRFNVSPQNDHL